MEDKFITLSKENILNEHICCAFTSKECKEGYELKKEWLKREFENGYVFRRLDAKAKVFIEYGNAETSFVPIDASGYLVINCFWVAGQYKGKGYAKALLQSALDDAKRQGKKGVVAVTGTKKFHFMSDPKWLLRQGFETCETLPHGFSLLVKKVDSDADNPSFKKSTKTGECNDKEGVVAYYSNRCPFTEFYVNNVLASTVAKRNLPLKIYKLETMADVAVAPSPATIFSLFYNGKFVTTDISACTDSKFDKIVK